MLRSSGGLGGQSKTAVPGRSRPHRRRHVDVPPPWALAGGWAVDAWLGRVTRDHLDVDIAVFANDHQALLEHFAGWQLIGHDEGMTNQGALISGTVARWSCRPTFTRALPRRAVRSRSGSMTRGRGSSSLRMASGSTFVCASAPRTGT